VKLFFSGTVKLNFGKKIYPSQTRWRDKNFRLFRSERASPRSKSFASELMTVRKWSEERAKNRCAAAGMRSRIDHPFYLDCVTSLLLSAPVFQAAAHHRTVASFSIFVWQAYRVRPAKKGRAERVARALLYPRKSGRGYFQGRLGSRKMGRRIVVESISKKKKKNITLSSLCVKRSGRKCKRR